MHRTIGVSAMSFFPLFLRPGGWGQIRTMVEMGGEAGTLPLQLLPLRGLQETHVAMFDVVSFEGPWNYGTLVQAAQRFLHVKGDENPSFIDLALFGSEANCTQRIEMIRRFHPRALAIDAPEWAQGGLIELGPNMHKGAARRWNGYTPSGVVLDTFHWMELGDQAETILAENGGYPAVKAIHLRLSSTDDTQEFLSQSRSSVARELLAEFADQAPNAPIIIEAQGLKALEDGSRYGPQAGLYQIVKRIKEVIQ